MRLYNPFERPLVLRIKRASSFYYLVAFLHLLCACAVLFVTENQLLRMVLWLGIGFAYYHSYKSDSVLNDAADLVLDKQSGWRLYQNPLRYLNIELLHKPFITPWLIILSFKLPDNSVKRAFLTRDMLQEDDLRRLRARLKVM